MTLNLIRDSWPYPLLQRFLSDNTAGFLDIHTVWAVINMKIEIDIIWHDNRTDLVTGIVFSNFFTASRLEYNPEQP